MLASDLAAALDPVVLAEQVGLEPDAWQQDVLRSTADRVLLNISRQVGKSTTAATLALWTAQYQAPALVLLLSPSLRQSAELFRKVLDAYRATVEPVPAEFESLLRLELANGSRIVSLPGKEGTVRGYSGVKLLIIDEAARVAETLYHACRPMLATSGGRLLALSTPNGKIGWFYHEWTAGLNWQRVEVHADQCARIPASFLAEERATLPAWFYEQEYCGVFHDPEDAAFRAEDIAAAFTDVPPLWGPSG